MTDTIEPITDERLDEIIVCQDRNIDALWCMSCKDVVQGLVCQTHDLPALLARLRKAEAERDTAAAWEREACAQVCDGLAYDADGIRARALANKLLSTAALNQTRWEAFVAAAQAVRDRAALKETGHE